MPELIGAYPRRHDRRDAVPRSPVSRTLFTIALALTGACTAFRPVTAPATAMGREVEVRFTRPRDVEALTSAGGRVVLDALHRAVGRPTEVRGDTLLLAVTAWRRMGSWRTERTPPVISLRLSDREMTIGQRGFSNAAAFAIVATPFVIVFLTLYWATYAQST